MGPKLRHTAVVLMRIPVCSQSYARSLAVSIVLATDLALSFDIIGKFKVTFQDKELQLNGDKEIKEAKEMLLKMVCASARARDLRSVKSCAV